MKSSLRVSSGLVAQRCMSTIAPLKPFELRMPTEAEVSGLASFIGKSDHLVCITGAGVSTSSGLPDYRGVNGSYKRGHKPMVHGDFMGSPASRQRYWSRSMIGWNRVSKVLPNDAHKALAALERMEKLKLIITQNVDRLHQKGGAQSVIDLHGRIDEIICMSCSSLSCRSTMQDRLVSLNPTFLDKFSSTANEAMRADGDVDLGTFDLSHFCVPGCKCGGILKPHFVFFGDNVPVNRVQQAYAEVDKADALLVVGTSLEVFSAYRFVLRASTRGIPIAIVNHGETRAERSALPSIAFRSDAHCGSLLSEAVKRLQQ